ncbi:MAG: DUF5320 domain-containing protein [Eubacteriales bacterium]
MPRRDGTGPMGAGSRTGRGLGICTVANVAKFGAFLGAGLGLGCRRGFGFGFGGNDMIDEATPKTQKELLQVQKELLKDRLQNIDKQLENL